MTEISTILLVHGAWANASAWEKVLPLLEKAGATAIAVALPLNSLKDDAAALRRAITIADGPVLLVGHSYGGVVITEAGLDDKVAGLVYIAAFAPDAGFLDYVNSIRQSTLVVQGSNDVIIPTYNSYVLQQNLPNAQLIMFPDSNHGSFYQYPKLFTAYATTFLDA